ncbi:MAG: hypothetical protein ACQET4_10300 [Pseudomonadota bacterium]
MVFAVSVTAASVQERDGAHPVMTNAIRIMLVYQQLLSTLPMQDAVRRRSIYSTTLR